MTRREVTFRGAPRGLTVHANWAKTRSPITYTLDGDDVPKLTPFRVTELVKSGRAYLLVKQWLVAQGVLES